MNAQAILQKIEDDALQTAAQAKEDAEKKVVELRADSDARIQTLREETLKQANAESEALSGRMRRMAELEARKLLLKSKRELMDEAFALAQTELCNTPAAEARAFLLKQAADAAQGDESLIVGANNVGWFDDAFLTDLNAALQAAGKKGGVTSASERREGATGVILSRAGTEVYCTFESMLDNVRASVETEIAQILFNE